MTDERSETEITDLVDDYMGDNKKVEPVDDPVITCVADEEAVWLDIKELCKLNHFGQDVDRMPIHRVIAFAKAAVNLNKTIERELRGYV